MNQNQFRPHSHSSIRQRLTIRQATHLAPQQTRGSLDCSFCGSIHPSERHMNTHMIFKCTASPMAARDDNTVPTPARRPPMMKSHTIQIPSDSVFTRFHTLQQNIGILQNKGQVTETSETKQNNILVKLSKDQTKQKHSDGATPGATVSDLTPQIVPVVNKSGKSPLKFLLRGIPVRQLN